MPDSTAEKQTITEQLESTNSLVGPRPQYRTLLVVGHTEPRNVPRRTEPRLLVDWLDVFVVLEENNDVDVVTELLVTADPLQKSPPWYRHRVSTCAIAAVHARELITN